MSRLCIFFSLAIFIVGCGGDEEVARPKPKPVPPPVEEVKPEPEVEEEIPTYVYSGDRFRDPFSPVGVSSSYVPDAVFEPQRAALKAIIYGPRSRGAVIIIGGSGSYYVKAGRIFDIMGKTVEGFRAKVLRDRVVITGDAEDEYEIKIRETEEEET